MSERFKACLDFVLKAEGGYVDHPADHGGPTCCGITQATLAEYLGHPVTVDQVQGLNHVTVAPIYDRLYWTPVHGDQLPKGVDLFVFDTAVNMGLGTAIRMLQGALMVPVDGLVGPVTLHAPALGYPKAVIQRLKTSRHGRYLGLTNFAVFGAGWMARLDNVTNQAIKDAS